MSVRSYINPYPPRFSQVWQESRLSIASTAYVQTKGGEQRDRMIRSLRNGDVVEVALLFLLAKLTGGAKRRTADLLAVMDAIFDRGASIVETETGRTSRVRKGWNAAVVQAREAIGTSARGLATGAKNGAQSRGRPKKDLTDKDWGIIRAHWPVRKGKTWKQSHDIIKAGIAPKYVSVNWLRENVK